MIRALAVVTSLAAVLTTGVAEARAPTTAVRVKDIDRSGVQVRDLTNVDGSLFFVVDDLAHGSELWASKVDARGNRRTTLVKDIVPGGGTAGSEPEALTSAGRTLYFVADDGIHGKELWRSDGTERGTTIVSDINPGEGGSDPSELTDVGGTLFFVADDRTHGKELWKSDGTTLGTALVKDIWPGQRSSHPRSLTNLNGTLVLAASDGTYQGDLWRSDGTAAGTFQIDFCPGDFYPCGSDPSEFEVVNDTLFFLEPHPFYIYEPRVFRLWKSDGTAEGTVRVSPYGGRELTAVGGLLFFSARDESHGRELWRSDGTTNGTAMVKDIYPGFEATWPAGSEPTHLTNVNGTLFFIAFDGIHGIELWKSDGTADGTMLVKDINPGADRSYPRPTNLTNVDGTLFFTASDGVHGNELWKSDGTAAGTTMVDIDRGGASSDPEELTSVGGKVFFSARTNSASRELWESDGTAAGTKLVKSFEPGRNGSDPSELTEFQHKLFFTASDGIHGSELWKSDGTNKHTVLVRDIFPGEGGSAPSELTRFGHALFFGADDGTHGRTLWKTDGTRRGTALVADMPAHGLTKVGGALYFVVNRGANGNQIWKSDGTTAGTTLLHETHDDYYQGRLTNVNGTLFFTAGDDLWKSDGTIAGTTRIKESLSYLANDRRFPDELTAVGDTLFFRAWDEAHGIELWKSDGTTEGTTVLEDINPGTGNSMWVEEDCACFSGTNDLTNVDGTLFFYANDGVHGPELWRSDGTPAGTSLVKDTSPFAFFGPYGRKLTNVDGTLFFESADGLLWKSDGTTSGTTAVSTTPRGLYSLTNVNGTLFFGVRGELLAQHGDTEIYKYELWNSDGTAAGTAQVSDVGLGDHPARFRDPPPHAFASIDGTLFFSGWDRDEGDVELWKTKPRIRRR